MIEDEIDEIAATDSGAADHLISKLTDEFRAGRDTSELLVLLDSSDAETVSLGVEILNEIAFKLYDSMDFLSRLERLLEHSSISVRFYALGALFPAFEAADPWTHAVLEKMRSDPNKGVRLRAEASTKRLLGETSPRG